MSGNIFLLESLILVLKSYIRETDEHIIMLDGETPRSNAALNDSIASLRLVVEQLKAMQANESLRLLLEQDSQKNKDLLDAHEQMLRIILDGLKKNLGVARKDIATAQEQERTAKADYDAALATAGNQKFGDEGLDARRIQKRWEKAKKITDEAQEILDRTALQRAEAAMDIYVALKDEESEREAIQALREAAQICGTGPVEAVAKKAPGLAEAWNQIKQSLEKTSEKDRER